MLLAFLILGGTVPVFATAQLTECWSDATTYVTSLPACSSFASSHSKCFALPGPTSVDTPAFKNCICDQKFFDLIIDCQSETRLCLESLEEDGAAQAAVSNWHQECNTWIDFKVTTPVLSTPSVTLAPIAECEAIETVCKIEGDLTKSCKQLYGSYTDLLAHPKLQSCLCKPSILSMQSRCTVDGDITCLTKSASVGDLDLWRECPLTARPTAARVEARATAPPAPPEIRPWNA
ncbi:hypothetical protein PV04_03008 [Phialophora macrospora]|uniref:Extracellular membrane protein CFEM domain-containing protein n=1 Tax=Phialophora macrospora TaxID=1851006 RepID=A0A0D2E8X3_9EURO|nr:hypothetical protein PV04_03008 [Phialophora macrospora]